VCSWYRRITKEQVSFHWPTMKIFGVSALFSLLVIGVKGRPQPDVSSAIRVVGRKKSNKSWDSPSIDVNIHTRYRNISKPSSILLTDAISIPLALQCIYFFQLPEQANARAQQVINFWTGSRRRSAIPLDRTIEELPDGTLRFLRSGTGPRKLQTTVADGDWANGGAINESAGRLFFSSNGL
jgi:hypothetical protein